MITEIRVICEMITFGDIVAIVVSTISFVFALYVLKDTLKQNKI